MFIKIVPSSANAEALIQGMAHGRQDVQAGTGNATRPPGRKTYMPIPESEPAILKDPGTRLARRVVVEPQLSNMTLDSAYTSGYRMGVARARANRQAPNLEPSSPGEFAAHYARSKKRSA